MTRTRPADTVDTKYVQPNAQTTATGTHEATASTKNVHQGLPTGNLTLYTKHLTHNATHVMKVANATKTHKCCKGD